MRTLHTKTQLRRTHWRVGIRDCNHVEIKSKGIRSPVNILVITLTMLALSSCASVPPSQITADRTEYGQVIADSWKRQTLLNVVRLRYADAPVFLEISSIINSRSVGGKTSAGVTLPNQTDPNVLNLGAEGTWSNTPTVTFQPLLGDRFSKSLLQPIPPSAVFQLLQAGWPVELVLPTTVGSINGLRNDSFSAGADLSFQQVVESLSRIQRAGGLGIRVEARKDGATVILVMRRSDADTALLENGRRVKNLLGLDAGQGEFEINYGLLPRSNHELAILSRSMLEIMLLLGANIELPEGHVTSGRVTAVHTSDAPKTILVHIHSGSQAPADSYAAVQYKNYWYWIDDNDIPSKRTFTFLMILFSLAETGQSYSAPTVTVPTR